MCLLLLFHQIISLALTQVLQAHLCHPRDRPEIRVLRVADLKMALSDVLRVKDRLRLCCHLADALCPGSLLQSQILWEVWEDTEVVLLVIETKYVVVFSKLSHFVFDRLADFCLSLHAMWDHSILHDWLILHTIGSINYAVFASFHSLNCLVKVMVTLSHGLFLIRCLECLLWEGISKPKVRPTQFCFCLQCLEGTQLIWWLLPEIHLLCWLTAEFLCFANQDVWFPTLVYDWWHHLQSLNLPVCLKVIKVVFFPVINYN